jgi:hypothetical protein
MAGAEPGAEPPVPGGLALRDSVRQIRATRPFLPCYPPTHPVTTQTRNEARSASAVLPVYGTPMKPLPNLTTLPKPLRPTRRSTAIARALTKKRRADQADADLDQLALAYRRQLKRLVPVREARAATAALAAIREKWHLANANARDVDPAKWEARRKAAVVEARRACAALLSNYAAIRKLQAIYRRQRRQLDRLWFQRVVGTDGANAWGGPRAPAVGDPDEVITRFNAENVWQDCWPENSIVTENSLARASIGTVINNFHFDQDNSTVTFLGFDLPGFRRNTSFAAVGADFKMPRDGTLRISAQLANYYNRITMSLSDLTGISSGRVRVTPSLFISVARLDQVETMDKLLLNETLDDEDSSWFSVLPDMERSYTWERQTSTAYQKDETVTIFVGCKVHIHSTLDDMNAKVNALLWWQLKKLSVWVQ